MAIASGPRSRPVSGATAMLSEDDLRPISAVQHLLFCERQCALIHIERLWAENRLTVEGRHLHEKAHTGRGESRDGVRIVRGLPLRSLRLGLAGVADVVEIHDPDQRDSPALPAAPAGALSARPPPGHVVPVEYKRGRPKSNDCDRIQLCAQALCLEEMLGTAVPVGALFYGQTRRRVDVALDADLRGRTEQAAARLHTLLAAGRTPPAVCTPRCRNCSLRQFCVPEVTGGERSAVDYLRCALLRLERAPADAREEP